MEKGFDKLWRLVCLPILIKMLPSISAVKIFLIISSLVICSHRVLILRSSRFSSAELLWYLIGLGCVILYLISLSLWKGRKTYILEIYQDTEYQHYILRRINNFWILTAGIVKWVRQPLFSRSLLLKGVYQRRVSDVVQNINRWSRRYVWHKLNMKILC